MRSNGMGDSDTRRERCSGAVCAKEASQIPAKAGTTKRALGGCRFG
jgi:hypothetical protein